MGRKTGGKNSDSEEKDVASRPTRRKKMGLFCCCKKSKKENAPPLLVPILDPSEPTRGLVVAQTTPVKVTLRKSSTTQKTRRLVKRSLKESCGSTVATSDVRMSPHSTRPDLRSTPSEHEPPPGVSEGTCLAACQ